MTDIYFGTNRNPTPKNNPSNFGKHFGEDGLANLRFGKASVLGKQVKVDVHAEKLAKAPGQNAPAPNSKLGSTTMFEGLRKDMLENRRDTVVFIHGYNVTFKEAMLAAAKLQRNFSKLNNAGVNVVCFSWPSDGSMMPWFAYANDRRDAAASGPAFARGLLKLRDFVQSLAQGEACGQKIHLVAHSMGNYVLRHALQEVRSQTGDQLPRMFDQVFLMAADEDDDAFEHDHKLRLLPRLARHVNVYFNRGDAAMAISDSTKANPDRLGDNGPRAPFTVPAKVTQIDCSDVVSGMVEHSYFLDTPRVVDDMLQVLAGTDPMLVGGRVFRDDRNRFVIANG